MPDWIQGLDERALRWSLDCHTQFLDRCFLSVTALGSREVLALLALFALGLLLLEGQYRRAALVALAVVGVYFAGDALKDLVGRPRPALGKGPPTPGSPSFPSSHASLSLTVFLVVALCLRVGAAVPGRRTRPYVLAWAVALALLVGASRLYLGAHYPSDVAGGWLLGLAFIALFCAADRLTDRRGKPDS